MRTALALAVIAAVCMCSSASPERKRPKVEEGGENEPSSFCAKGEGTRTPEHQPQIDGQGYNEFEKRFDNDPDGELRQMKEIFEAEKEFNDYLRKTPEEKGGLLRPQATEKFSKFSVRRILGLGDHVSKHLVKKARIKVACFMLSLSGPRRAEFRELFYIITGMKYESLSSESRGSPASVVR
jgi:hypothetical protein